MRFLGDVMSQAEIIKKWVPNFWCIVIYTQWNVKITQENNLVELSPVLFKKNSKVINKCFNI